MKQVAILIIICALTAQLTSAETYKETLPNGITLITKPDITTDVVAVTTFLDVAAVDEPENLTGITELTNRLLTAGTKTRTRKEISEQIEFVGGVFNVKTSTDFSAIQLKTTKEYDTLVFDILEDILTNPTFPAEEFEKEKKQLLAEIKAKKNNPQTVAHDFFIKNIFQEHYYQHPLEGYEETVTNIQLSDVNNYYLNNYLSKTIIVAVGNINPVEVLSRVEKIQVKPKSRQQHEYPPQDILQTQSFSINQPLASSFLYIGFRGPALTNKDYPSIKVIEALLSTGMSSRLFQELRDKQGLAYTFRAKTSATKQPGYFAILTTTTFLKKTIEGILQQIEKLRTEPVSEKELADAQQKIRGRYLLDHEQSDKQAYYLGFYEIAGVGYQFDDMYLTHISKTRPEDIQQSAQKYFKTSTTSILGPETPQTNEQ